MACGTPVIATGTGGSSEFLVDERNSLLVPRGDAVALANAVRRLAGEPGLRDSLVAGAAATVSELSVERLANSLDAWNRAAAGGFRDLPPTEEVRASANEPGPDA
jgi:glycosyltransferase involved in cell wall biosynthesis